MNFFFIHPFKLRRDPADAHTYRNPIHDQSQGGEFLDDAIYREDVQEIQVSYSDANNTPEAMNNKE